MSKMTEQNLKVEEIEEFLDQNVRPYLASHYGDVNVVKFADGVLEIKLAGACANCPAAEETLQNRVINQLEEEFTQIEIETKEGVSEDLLNQAKEILKKRRD